MILIQKSQIKKRTPAIDSGRGCGLRAGRNEKMVNPQEGWKTEERL